MTQTKTVYILKSSQGYVTPYDSNTWELSHAKYFNTSGEAKSYVEWSGFEIKPSIVKMEVSYCLDSNN